MTTSPDSPLKAVLLASLALEEGRTQGADNPLAEANPESLDDLFDAVNQKLIAGMPEAITAEDLLPVIGSLRAMRLKFLQDQDRKAAAGPRRSGVGQPAKTVKQVLDAADLDI